jgi:protein tyrosine/serine phosphatase
MKQLATLIACAALTASAIAQDNAVTPPVPASPRPARWAEPITLEGAPNLHRISPMLYRSEQPTELGMKNLEKLGIRTVINLRYFNHDDDEVKGTSLRAERTKILTWRVDDRHVVEVMRMLKKAGNGPFLIHCQHGADRTGLMSAMYRRLYDGWSAEDALLELTDGGYGYHSIWRNIQRYVRDADVQKLRAEIDAP